MRRLRRVLLSLVLGLAILVALPILLLSLGPVRERLVRAGVERATDRVTGELRLGHVDWGRPGRLRLGEFAWTAAGDTLAAAESLELVIALRPLLARRIVVERLVVDGAQADVPAVLAAQSAPSRPAETDSSHGMARPTDLDALLPPIRVHEARVHGRDLRLAEGHEVGTFDFAVAAEIAPDRPSWVTLDLRNVVDAAEKWAIDSLSIAGDLDSLKIEGELRARAHDTPFGGLFVVDVAPDPQDLALDATIDLSATEWLDELRLVVKARGAAVTIDTLRASLPGLRFTASGVVDTAHVDVRASLDLSDGRLLERLSPAARDVDLQTRVEIAASGPLRNPDVGLTAEGRLFAPAASLPRFEVSIATESEGRRIRFAAPEGATTGATRWNHIELDALLPADTLAAFPLRAEMRADGEEIGAALVADVDRAPTGELVAEVSRLALRLRDRDLESVQPFGLAFDPATEQARVEGLYLLGELGSVRAEGRIGADTLDAQADLELEIPPDVLRALLPESARSRSDDLGLAITGHVVASGTPASPVGRGEVHAELVTSSDEPGLRVDVAGELATAGARADLTIARGGTTFATGRLALPGRLDPTSKSWSVPPGEAVAIALDAPGIDLEVLNPLLPPELRLDGELRAKLEATGALDELALSGDVRLADLEARIDDRSSVAATCDLHLEGTSRALRVSGKLETTSGSIELPPPPPKLHPSEGVALLWGVGEAPAELTPDPVSGASSADAVPPSAVPPPAVDLDIEVLIPGEVWLHGPGLEMELAGDVRIRSLPASPSKAGADAASPTGAPAPPAVSGTIEVRQGTYRFMDREFVVERGLATLYGEPDPNPELDIALRTETGEAVVQILITGTAKEPSMALVSEPEMSEGEILTLLVSESRESVDPAALLTGLGLSRLTRQAAARTGLDTIEYRSGTDDGEASSLVVGKYLSPRLVLKYEQSLEEASAFLTRLDYVINRHFKLKTSYAAGGESGVELFWSRTD